MLCGEMARVRAPLTGLVASALTVSACGQDPVRVAGGTLAVTVDEYRLRPQDVSVAPGRLTLVVRDTGRLTHNLRVAVSGGEPGEAPRLLGGTPTAHPGETVRGSVRLEPGEYRLVCTIANHDDLGMRGVLTVEGR